MSSRLSYERSVVLVRCFILLFIESNKHLYLLHKFVSSLNSVEKYHNNIWVFHIEHIRHLCIEYTVRNKTWFDSPFYTKHNTASKSKIMRNVYRCQEYFEKNVENDLNKYHGDAKMLDSVSNVMIWFSYTVKCIEWWEKLQSISE